MMKAADLIGELASLIYQEPLSKLRETGEVKDLTQSVNNVILIIDFNTERLMNGILNFFGNSTGIYANETRMAFNNIGAFRCSGCLARMISIASTAGMTYESIQLDRSIQLEKHDGVTGFTTSWDETHGGKWKIAQDELIAIDADFDEMEMHVKLEEYVDGNFKEIFDIYVRNQQLPSPGRSALGDR